MAGARHRFCVLMIMWDFTAAKEMLELSDVYGGIFLGGGNASLSRAVG